ncbi:hypothetical protein OH77DRAFT_1477922 [Trametes cingulata]|nr:hypothetical protein OH77DRAFT_1477922 [Trametes cingulata]
MTTTTVYAKERGRTPYLSPLHPTTSICIHYDVPILPRSPLKVGKSLKIATLQSCDALFPPNGQKQPPRYTARLVEVVGTIIGVRAQDRATIDFIVRNEAGELQAVYAYITVPIVDGITDELSMWQCAYHLILTLATTTPARTVEIETDAVILRDNPAYNAWINDPLLKIPTNQE